MLSMLASLIIIFPHALFYLIEHEPSIYLRLLVAPMLALAFYYILPFGLVNFALEGKIMSAFDVKAIRKAFSPGYFAYWLLLHVYIAVLFSVLSALFFLPVLNFLLAGFILFVYASTGFNLYTQLFLERR